MSHNILAMECDTLLPGGYRLFSQYKLFLMNHSSIGYIKPLWASKAKRIYVRPIVRPFSVDWLTPPEAICRQYVCLPRSSSQVGYAIYQRLNNAVFIEISKEIKWFRWARWKAEQYFEQHRCNYGNNWKQLKNDATGMFRFSCMTYPANCVINVL